MNIPKTVRRVFSTVLMPSIIILLVLSCGKEPEPKDMSAKAKVFVSILPQGYLAQRVGGGHVDISVLVPPGQSPETFEPAPQQMAALSEADIICGIGIPFEDVLFDKIISAMPNITVVRTDRDITKIPMESAHGHSHAGEPAGAPDPHVWLDPKRAIKISEAIRDALGQIAPNHKNDFEANFLKLKDDLTRADSLLTEKLRPYRGRAFYVMHPAFGYFAEAYGLKQKAVEVEGKEPSARELAEIINDIRTDRARVIFVQKQFSSVTVERLATDLGVAVVSIDPLEYQYIDNLMKMADAIAESLEEKR
jgi:zinc transport system substrate-binding protein